MASVAHDTPLRVALRAEFVRLERAVLLGSAIVYLTGLGIISTLVVRGMTSLALSLLPVLLAFCAYVLVARAFLKRGKGTRWLPVVNPLVETLVPTAVFFITTREAGAATAVTGSTTMQVYAIGIMLAVLRMRTFLPLVVSAVSTTEYALVYLLYVKDQVPVELTAIKTLQPEHVLGVRAVILLVSGAVGTLVAWALQRAVTTASGEARAQELFGKYRLGERLASGGMGVVFRATYCPEGGFQRPVALKRIHAHLVENPELVKSFRDEAELCARLTHPNIVQVLDFGRVEDTYFLAMEFVDGMTLSDLLRRSRAAGMKIPPPVAAWIGKQICQGLAYAHRGARDDSGQVLHVIHRDLNPPNILLSHGGDVKIVDFGIAKPLRNAEATLTGRVMGKMSYMAPEQAQGLPLDERCDLFAVGIILWEALALEPLFRRDSDAATLLALLNDEVKPPSQVRGDVSAAWDSWMERALQRDPARRFQSAQEMGDALDAILDVEGWPRADEVAAFLASVPRTSVGTITAPPPDEAPTVKMRPPVTAQ
ncbi:MAG: serine/threonine-protein kinase [Myxococcota bacterium]